MEDLGLVEMERLPRAVRCRVFDRWGDGWGNPDGSYFGAPRLTFVTAMRTLNDRLPGLPGRTNSLTALVKAEFEAGLSARLRQTLFSNVSATINHAATLVVYTGGVAVVTPPGGNVWHSSWDDLLVCASPNLHSAGEDPMLLELANRAGEHVALQLPPLALFGSDDLSTDNFLKEPYV